MIIMISTMSAELNNDDEDGWMYCMKYDDEHFIVLVRHNSLATPEYPKVVQEDLEKVEKKSGKSLVFCQTGGGGLRG